MELLTKIIALSALVIGVLAFEGTWYLRDLQRRGRELSAHITQLNLNIRETPILTTRVHKIIHQNRKPSP